VPCGEIEPCCELNNNRPPRYEPCTGEDEICNLPGREGECLPITTAPAPALSDVGKFVGLGVLLLIAVIQLWRRRPLR
jgi:hypothetical protein